MSRSTNYKIVNSATGNDFFDTAGSATTDSTQPNLDTGSSKALGASQSLMDNVAHGFIQRLDGSTVVSGVGGAQEARADGQFATMTEGAYVIGRVSTTLAGVANTALQTMAGAHSKRSIHKREVIRAPLVATAIRDGQWHVFSGVFNPALVSSNTGLADSSGVSLTAGFDEAANPTIDKPGELVYTQGGKPTAGEGAADGVFMDDYKARSIF